MLAYLLFYTHVLIDYEIYSWCVGLNFDFMGHVYYSGFNLINATDFISVSMNINT